MVLEATAVRKWFGLVRRVQITAFCTEHHIAVADPFIGCGNCHPEAAALFRAVERLQEDRE